MNRAITWAFRETFENVVVPIIVSGVTAWALIKAAEATAQGTVRVAELERQTANDLAKMEIAANKPPVHKKPRNKQPASRPKKDGRPHGRRPPKKID